jgi:GTPase SAR1 family protein
MRIGFIGTQGTGKTSMAQALMETEYFKDNGFIFSPSSSRRLAGRLGINKSASPFSQLAITVARVGDEDKASNGGKINTVSDRTPLDSLAYTKYQYDHVWKAGDPEAETCLEVSKGLVERSMRDYDVIAYFPNFGWPEVDDGVRPQGAEYQNEIAFNCQSYLAQFGIRPYLVANEPVDKRATHMVSWLKRRM